jgi:hypothetical protein
VDQYLWQYTIDNDDGDEDKDIGTASSRPQPDCTSGSPPAASADEVANTPPANKKRKLNEVLSLTDAMPDDNDVRQLYSHLCRALGLDDGFDPTDSSVRKSTVALLTEINHLLSTEYESTTLEFPRHAAMIHSVTQKNGSMLQSEYQDQRKETPSTRHTVSPTISGAFTRTLYSLHVRHKELP